MCSHIIGTYFVYTNITIRIYTKPFTMKLFQIAYYYQYHLFHRRHHQNIFYQLLQIKLKLPLSTSPVSITKLSAFPLGDTSVLEPTFNIPAVIRTLCTSCCKSYVSCSDTKFYKRTCRSINCLESCYITNLTNTTS